MRIKVSLTNPVQVVNVPCDSSITVDALIALLIKRVPNLPADVSLYFDGGQLFGEDTLGDLGIKEGDSVYDTLGGTALTPPLSPSSAPAQNIANNNNNNNNNNNSNNAAPNNNNAQSAPADASPDPSGNAGAAPAPAPAAAPVPALPSSAVVAPLPPTAVAAPASPSSSSSAAQSSPEVLYKPAPRALQEIIMICFDISSSMKCVFVRDLDDGLGDCSVTRVAAAKICFGAFIDKTLAFEYPHAIGLIVFGSDVTERIPISDNLDKFEQIFGSLNDSQGSTHLYPAVRLSVKKILDHKRKLQDEGTDISKLRYRIIAFTDGEDNSGMHSHDVAESVLANNIVVDAVVIGGSDDACHTQLRSLAHVTGGYTIRIPEDRVTLSNIFERESVLALSQRPEEKPFTRPNLPRNEFLEFGNLAKYPVIGDQTLSSAPKVKTGSQAAPVSRSISIKSAPSSSNDNNNNNNNNSSTPVTFIPASTSSKVSGGAVKRIAKELADIQKIQPDFYEVFVSEDDISDWKIIVKGPPNTPYEGGHWMINFVFPNDYPFNAMKVNILTPLYHCNVSNEGRVCMDVLKDQWSPALTADRIMQSFREMMIHPNALDALDAWKGSLARTQPDVYEKNVREHTKQNASGPVEDLKRLFNIQ